MARHEWAVGFGRWIAPMVLGVFLAAVLVGTVWLDDVLLSGVASLRSAIGWMAGCIVLTIPAVAARTFAEERSSGVLQWLGTLPVTAWELVLARWLATVGVATLGLVLTLPLPIVVGVYGDLDPGPVIGGYLALWLLGAAVAAVGVAASAAARSVSVAFVVAVAIGVGLGLLPWALPVVPLAWVPTVQQLALSTHLSSMARGVIDTRSLVYFGGSTLAALSVAVLALEHRRLR